jgi:hypothetical protein
MKRVPTYGIPSYILEVQVKKIKERGNRPKSKRQSQRAMTKKTIWY